MNKLSMNDNQLVVEFNPPLYPDDVVFRTFFKESLIQLDFGLWTGVQCDLEQYESFADARWKLSIVEKLPDHIVSMTSYDLAQITQFKIDHETKAPINA
jgi:hypothetical protein